MNRLQRSWSRLGEGWRGALFTLGFLVVWLCITLPLYLFLPRSEVFKDVSAVLQSFITALAVAAGGYFALFKLQVFRNLQPHLTIEHEISHRIISDSYAHISVTAVLRNSSRVKVELREGFFRLQQVVPTTDEEVEDLYAEVFEDARVDADEKQRKKKEHVQWPVLDTHKLIRSEGELGEVVEPGGAHPETYEFIVPRNVESVLVYTYFANPAYSEGSGVAKGWHATSVYDISYVI